MKKSIKFVFLATIIFLIKTFSVNASTIDSIKVDVILDDNGNAHIEELWNVNTDTGTELYKPITNLVNSKISNFKVSLNNKYYVFYNVWDVNRTFTNKSYKNGINKIDNGIELCWGISKYGTNTYNISYDVSNFVYNLNDAQIIY